MADSPTIEASERNIQDSLAEILSASRQIKAAYVALGEIVAAERARQGPIAHKARRLSNIAAYAASIGGRHV